MDFGIKSHIIFLIDEPQAKFDEVLSLHEFDNVVIECRVSKLLCCIVICLMIQMGNLKLKYHLGHAVCVMPVRISEI